MFQLYCCLSRKVNASLRKFTTKGMAAQLSLFWCQLSLIFHRVRLTLIYLKSIRIDPRITFDSTEHYLFQPQSNLLLKIKDGLSLYPICLLPG